MHCIEVHKFVSALFVDGLITDFFCKNFIITCLHAFLIVPYLILIVPYVILPILLIYTCKKLLTNVTVQTALYIGDVILHVPILLCPI